MLSKIIKMLKIQYRSPKQLAECTGLSLRQVYRYLDEGKKSGQITKVLPGLYGLSNSLPPSFEEYQSNLKFSSGWMSKKQQQNKTIHSKKDFQTGMNEKSASIKPNMTTDRNVSMDSSQMSLRQMAILILSTACLDYSEFELRLAMNKLRDVQWYAIDQNNVHELVADARERYLVAHKKYGNIEYPIPYFFGILRRMLISSMMKERQESYKSFVMNYACDKKAAGAEELTTFVESTSAHGPAVETPIVQEEWQPVKETFHRLANDHSIRLISDVQINLAIQHLSNNGHYPDRVDLALHYLREHDCEGACYLIQHLHTPSKVEEAIQKNWRRVKKTMNHSGIEKENMQPIRQRDERYSAFYNLFPDV